MHARRGGLARRRTPVDWRTKMLCIQVTIRSSLKILAPTIKVRWICEQAHQQLKEELGLDHFEVRSWTGLHRHVRLDDHDRLRLSPSPPPQSCGTEKRVGGPPPQSSMPAVRQAILDLFMRSPPGRCPHCQKLLAHARESKLPKQC